MFKNQSFHAWISTLTKLSLSLSLVSFIWACSGSGGASSPEPAERSVTPLPMPHKLQTMMVPNTGQVHAFIMFDNNSTWIEMELNSDRTRVDNYTSPPLSIGTHNIRIKFEFISTVNEQTIVVAEYSKDIEIGAGSNELPANASDEYTYPNGESWQNLVNALFRTITFTDSGTVYKFINDVYTNVIVDDDGIGVITYESSDETLANVDSNTGEVTFIAPGLVEITATKTSAAGHVQARATYAVNISPRNILVNAFIGETGTELIFPSVADGMQFTRSTDSYCDPAEYLVCEAGQQDDVAIGQFTDLVANLSNPAWYWLSHGTHNTIAAPASQDSIFSGRYGAGFVEYQDKLWLFGGQGKYSYEGDVWNSVDGEVWTKVAEDVQVLKRRELNIVVFNDLLWLVDTSYSTEVHVSTDGVTWTKVSDDIDAGFQYRDGAEVAVFNGQIFIIGGHYRYYDSGLGQSVYTFPTDVWTSSDGSNWSQITTNISTEYSGRRGHQLVNFNGKLWIIGGYRGTSTQYPGDTNKTYLTDVWSWNGVDAWSETASAVPFGGREGHRVAVHNNKMWVVGGYRYVAGGERSTYYLDDAWYSDATGIAWNKASTDSAFSNRANAQLVSFQNKLWVIGGRVETYGYSYNYLNDVWYIEVGNSWQAVSAATISLPFDSFGYGIESAVVAGEMWVYGSYYEEVHSDKKVTVLYTSNDGIGWQQVELDGQQFQNNSSLQMVVYDDKLWLFGGCSEDIDYNCEYLDGVWYFDGVSLQQDQTEGGFPGGSGVKTIEALGKLWLIPKGCYDKGTETTLPCANVWFHDGNGWQADVPDSWDSSSNKEVYASDNRLWILDTYNDHSWMFDGINWSYSAIPFDISQYSNDQTIAFNEKLYVIGGAGSANVGGATVYSQRNEIWSLDAGGWSSTVPIGYDGLGYSKVIEFENKLWIIGGYYYANSASSTQTFSNRLWSFDGLSWTSTAPVGYVGSSNPVVIQDDNAGMLWIGQNYSIESDDKMAYFDGVTWTVLDYPFVGTERRYGVQYTTFGGTLIMTSGYYYDDIASDSIYPTLFYSLEDGSWDSQSVTGIHGQRDYQFTVFDNKLLLSGGKYYENYNILYDSSLVSFDGVDWKAYTPQGYTSRDKPLLEAFAGKLWLISGTQCEYECEAFRPLNDVWAFDGLEWKLPKQFLFTFPK